jgi:FixJ family two-component response regulator
VLDDSTQPILVVIEDETVRRRVCWVLAEWDVRTQLVSSWRVAFVTTNGAPACIIADLDDGGENAGGVAVLRKGWGGTVPLIVLSQHADVDERAAHLGAVAGLRKPLNGAALLGTVQQLVPLPD